MEKELTARQMHDMTEYLHIVNTSFKIANGVTTTVCTYSDGKVIITREGTWRGEFWQTHHLANI